MSPKWLSTKELQAVFGISRRACHTIRLGGILPPHILVGKRRRLRLDEVEQFFRDQAEAELASTSAKTEG